jgi:hypothetical protein
MGSLVTAVLCHLNSIVTLLESEFETDGVVLKRRLATDQLPAVDSLPSGKRYLSPGPAR